MQQPDQLVDETSSEDAGDIAPRYPVELACTVRCEGLQYRVRPIGPEDEDGLAAFHEGLSPRSTYLRFFTCHPHLTPDELFRFTHVDYERRLALVAETEDGIIGVGRFDCCEEEPEAAEVAFVVGDQWQRHGVASLLLDELVTAARRRGIARFIASTLVENHAMLDVFAHCGFPLTRETDYETVSLSFPLAETSQHAACLARRDATRTVLRDVGAADRC